MKVLKILFKLLVLLTLCAYLCYAFIELTGKGNPTPCEQVNIRINHEERGFIHKAEIMDMLHDASLYPIGIAMDNINGKHIEATLLQNPYIQDVVCFKSPAGQVNILIDQRIPVLRVMAESGADYYVSDEGDCLPPLHYSANLVVATGNIDSTYASTTLKDMANFVTSHPFWNSQIEQVHIAKDRKATIYPRIGKQKIHFGKVEKVETKLSNLKLFYDKVMPIVGWNKYKELNIAHTNQVVGTR